MFELELPPYERLEIETGRNIALISGNAPRLVVREGSSSFDLWEGQSLPIHQEKAWVINPFSRPIRCQMAYDLPLRIAVPGGFSSERHIETVLAHLRAPGATADPEKRYGVGVMPLRGEWICKAYFSSGAEIRVTHFPGAELGFMAFRPEDAFAVPAAASQIDNRRENDLQCVAGHFVDPDIIAWIAASGYKGVQAAALITPIASNYYAWKLDRNSAIFFSSEPNQVFLPRLTFQSLGVPAREFD